MNQTLTKLLEQKKQLDARIQQVKNRERVFTRRQRNGKLIAYGIVMERLLADTAYDKNAWVDQCTQILDTKTLQRALLDELIPEKKPGKKST